MENSAATEVSNFSGFPRDCNEHFVPRISESFYARPIRDSEPSHYRSRAADTSGSSFSHPSIHIFADFDTAFGSE